MLDKLTSADFSPHLNEIFQIHVESGKPVDAELIEVTVAGSWVDRGVSPAKRAPFSIVFQGPTDCLHCQGIHKIEHREMGVLELFLVPVGPGEGGMCYEAVFN
jgi:hypothetical protein